MSSDGHASDRSRSSIVDESDDVVTEAGEASHQESTNDRQRSPTVDEETSNEEDGHVTGHTHRAGEESDDVEMDQYGNPGDDVLTGSQVGGSDTSEEGDALDEDQHLSPDQGPPSHQVPSEDSRYSPRDTESINSADGQSEVESGPRVEGVRARSKNRRKRKSPTAEADPSLTDRGTMTRPLKKVKGPFKRAYLDLLNEDIEHAAAQYVPARHDSYSERMGMPASQVGMTVWTPLEKERFFEALGRLGRDNAAGIALRIRTKGEMEVRQYMKLLRDGLALRRKQGELDTLELADFPAAIELSHECCQALEGAADNIALRQEHSEKTVERNKHGSGWLLTQENSRNQDGGGAEGSLSDPAMVFNIPNYLSLSERLFMNGPSEQTNWKSIEEDAPSIRRTTLDDLNSLALTLTRRLVAASIFMASSRIRAERGYKANKPDVVRKKDVHATALSLGLGTEARSLLASCPRRLGLHVYEEPPKATDDEARGGVEPMAYEDVEAALGVGGKGTLSRIEREVDDITLSSDEDPVFSDARGDEVSPDSDESDGNESEGEEEIKAEADEAIFYSAVDPPQTKRDRQVLLRRIKAEQEQEKHADAVDAKATYHEEGRMWALLGQPPPEPLADPGSPPSGRRMKIRVDAAYSVGKDWRAKTKVMSRWESQYQRHG